MNWRILKALTARGEVTRVQGNREESTPPFRELGIEISDIRVTYHNSDTPPFRELEIEISESDIRITNQNSDTPPFRELQIDMSESDVRIRYQSHIS